MSTRIALCLALACALVHCGDSDAADPVVTTFVPGPVSVVLPAHGATYQVAPPIVAVYDRALTDAQRASIRATVNGTDVSTRLSDDGATISARGLGDVLREGANTVVVTFEAMVHEIGFTFACGSACATQTPVLTGPSETVEMAQLTVTGEHLGGPGDRRVVYVNGQAFDFSGGTFAGGILPLFAPPAVTGAMTVEVEVNGVKSAPLVIAVNAAPPLAVSVDDPIDGYVAGLAALTSAVRALPVTTTGDAEVDAALTALASAADAELVEALADIATVRAGLSDETKPLLARFLNEGRLDELLIGWASDVPKADGVPGFNDMCEGDILRLYRVVAFLKVVRDRIHAASAICAVLFLVAGPAAVVLLKELATFLFIAWRITAILELWINTVLPTITAATVKIPAVVSRNDEVSVTGTVTFLYDPAEKATGIAIWTANRLVVETLNSTIGAAGAGLNITPLVKQTAFRTAQLANALGTWAGKIRGGESTGPPPFTLPAYPPYLDVDFELGRFELVEPDGPIVGCAVTGRWVETEACLIGDQYVIGRNLVQTGWDRAVFSSNLGEGTVSTGLSDILSDASYDDPDYGRWLEKFADDARCTRMQECWDDYSDLGCGPSALGPDGDCAGMFLGFCPTQNDFQTALTYCQLCYEL